MTRYLAIAALLTGCGGGGVVTDFGWWNGKNTPGTLSIAEPSEYQNALASGQKPIVIVWTAVQSGDHLVPGWRENLQAVINLTPKAYGYYAFDEPNLHGLSQEDQAAVIEELPDKIVMVSLSTPELGMPVHPRVNLLGVNLYSSAGVTPDTAHGYLDQLAAYGRPMYLNLDAVWVTTRGSSCANVPVTAQKRSIALNDAILQWGPGMMRVAFLWQSGDDGTNQVCGASDMPLVRRYIETIGG